jgi:hypothetical protein
LIECYERICKLDLLLMGEAADEQDISINILGEDDQERPDN